MDPDPISRTLGEGLRGASRSAARVERALFWPGSLLVS